VNKLIWFLTFLLLPVISSADQFSLYLENDVTAKTDHYFTHGTRLQYLTDEGYGFSLGQSMYTPDNKWAKELLPYDRPYAGFLYLSAFDTIVFTNGNNLYLELQMGMTGPDSLAEDTQIWVHEHIGSMIPQGWKNQVYSHFAFLFINRYTMPVYESSYFAIDPYVGTQIGNLADYITSGLNVYLGYNLPSTRNQPVIPFKGIRGEGWQPYAYLYAGIEPKLMLYNMLLEDHRFLIHPNSFVYDQNSGVVLGCKYCELTFSFCIRSREFEEQMKPEKFGSAKLSVNF